MASLDTYNSATQLYIVTVGGILCRDKVIWSL